MAYCINLDLLNVVHVEKHATFQIEHSINKHIM